MNIAIIPARGGSKRIPHKNIKEFMGKPIIAYSIEAAQKSGLFDKIIVSTDDEKIAQVAKSYGAETPFIRPENLSDDYTGVRPVLKHAINWLISHGETPEYICCIYATVPFIQIKYIKESYQLLKNENFLFVFAATDYPFPIFRSLRKLPNYGVEPIWPEYASVRSQDLEYAIHDAGQFYWGTAESFLSDEKMYSNESEAIILPRYLVQDIDTEDDWLLAEYMSKVINKKLSSMIE